MKATFAILFTLILGASPLFLAAQNLGGYITARLTNDYPITYQIDLYTLTDVNSGVDPCVATLYMYDRYGDSIVSVVPDIPRTNGPFMTGIPNGNCPVSVANEGQLLMNEVRWNHYRVSYIIPQTVWDLRIIHFDPGLHPDFVNVPDTTDENFVVYTDITIFTPDLQPNSTSIPLNVPINTAFVGQSWNHLPGAYSVEGDFILYKLVPSPVFDLDSPISMQNPSPMAGYQFPDDSAFGGGSLTIDPRTGILTWDSPQQTGLYLITYEISGLGGQADKIVRTIPVKVIDAAPQTDFILADFYGACLEDTFFMEFSLTNAAATDSFYFFLNNGPFHNNGPFGPETYGPVEMRVERYDGTTGVVDTFTEADLPIACLNEAGTPSDSLWVEIRWQAHRADWTVGNAWVSLQRTADYFIDIYAYAPVQQGQDRYHKGKYWTFELDQCVKSLNVTASDPASISFHPNPASTHIELSGLPAGKVHYTWLDPTGRVIGKGTLAPQDRSLSVKGFPTGIYLLTLTDREGGLYSGRVWVQ